MPRYYWYCEGCEQRGNGLYEERKDARKRVDLHRKKCGSPEKAKIRSTKSHYLPTHVIA